MDRTAIHANARPRFARLDSAWDGDSLEFTNPQAHLDARRGRRARFLRFLNSTGKSRIFRATPCRKAWSMPY